MDADRFLSAYPMLDEKLPPRNAERKELLDAPRTWMRFFNESMRRYLAGEDIDDHKLYISQLTDYYYWCHDYLDTVSKRLDKGDELKEARLSGELSFHFINHTVIPVWASLFEDEAFTDEFIDDIQFQLSMSTTPIARKYYANERKRSIQDEEDELSKVQRGLLTESDTMMTGLELMRSQPDIVIVPAPTRFEHNKYARSHDFKNRNVDFIAVDRKQRQVHGIQAKSSLNDTNFEHYDPDFVTLIDGRTDLGNTALKGRIITSRPGLLSMEFLASQPIQRDSPQFYRGDYLERRLVARELMRHTPPYIASAAKNIGARILHNLYKNPVH